MHRFFVAPELLANRADTPDTSDTPDTLDTSDTSDRSESPALPVHITLPEKLAHQVRDVLRLSTGEQLILLDNSGDEVLASIVKSSRAGVEVQVLERRPGKSESAVQIILCQGLLKPARFEWVLEKGTELGVAVFAPILCRRSMAGLEDTGSAKIERWRRIIQEAAEQCGRSRLPALLPVRPFTQALTDIPTGALPLIPWEKERNQTLRDVLGRQRPANAGFSASQQDERKTIAAQSIQVVIFIGPEGGFMPEEVELAQRHGVQPVTLGPRILRAETAALAAIANVMYELEK